MKTETKQQGLSYSKIRAGAFGDKIVKTMFAIIRNDLENEIKDDPSIKKVTGPMILDRMEEHSSGERLSPGTQNNYEKTQCNSFHGRGWEFISDNIMYYINALSIALADGEDTMIDVWTDRCLELAAKETSIRKRYFDATEKQPTTILVEGSANVEKVLDKKVNSAVRERTSPMGEKMLVYVDEDGEPQILTGVKLAAHVYMEEIIPILVKYKLDLEDLRAVFE